MQTFEILYSLRKSKGYSQKMIADFLGISATAYQNYEYGKTELNYSGLTKLADFYGVTTDYLLGREPKQPQKPIDDFADKANLKQMEKSILREYLKLSESQREAFLKFMVKITEEERERRETITVNLPKSTLKASAGTGNWLAEEEYERVDVVATPEAKKATMIVEVAGDSMTPMFDDGDLALVNTTAVPQTGDIGIFIVNGDGYIKKAGDGELISLNPKYENIKVTENDSAYAVGVVVGKAKLAK